MGVSADLVSALLVVCFIVVVITALWKITKKPSRGSIEVSAIAKATEAVAHGSDPLSAKDPPSVAADRDFAVFQSGRRRSHHVSSAVRRHKQVEDASTKMAATMSDCDAAARNDAEHDCGADGPARNDAEHDCGGDSARNDAEHVRPPPAPAGGGSVEGGADAPGECEYAVVDAEVPGVTGVVIAASIVASIEQDCCGLKKPSLTDADYKATSSHKGFCPYCGDLVSFHVESVAPQVFRDIRTSCGLLSKKFIEAFEQPLLGGNEGAGKSGMLFYKTHNSKFVIKTITSAEESVLRKLLPHLHQHFTEEENTVICRIFGVMKIKHSNPLMPPMRVIIMENAFDTSLNIDEIYDLKGSTVSRFVELSDDDDSVKVLKDGNFQSKIYLPPGDRVSILRQIRADVELFRMEDIMDYSMLVGISNSETCPYCVQVCKNYQRHKTTCDMRTEYFERQQDRGVRKQGTPFQSMSVSRGDAVSPREYFGGMRGSDGRVYYIRIVDILQKWNLKKRAERGFKVLKEQDLAVDVSSINPESYAERFTSYMESKIG